MRRKTKQRTGERERKGGTKKGEKGGNVVKLIVTLERAQSISTRPTSESKHFCSLHAAVR